MFEVNKETITDLVQRKILNQSMADFLTQAVVNNANIYIDGPTNIGKRNILTALTQTLLTYKPKNYTALMSKNNTAHSNIQGEHIMVWPFRLDSSYKKVYLRSYDLSKQIMKVRHTRPETIVIEEVDETEESFKESFLTFNNGHQILATTKNSVKSQLDKLQDSNEQYYLLNLFDIIITLKEDPESHEEYIDEIIQPLNDGGNNTLYYRTIFKNFDKKDVLTRAVRRKFDKPLPKIIHSSNNQELLQLVEISSEEATEIINSLKLLTNFFERFVTKQ